MYVCDFFMIPIDFFAMQVGFSVIFIIKFSCLFIFFN